MAEYEKKVRRILRDHGCYFVRHGKGDHDVWHSPITGRNITVDGWFYTGRPVKLQF
jgi:hypothetical protein